MRVFVTGSSAYDYIMVFPGKFQDHILADKVHVLSVSFLVDSLTRRRGGTGANIAYNPALLGEQLSGAKILAALIGLGGALLIIRPGAAVFQPASLLAFSTAFVFSVYIILTRKLAGLAPRLQSLFFCALVGAVLMTPIAPFVWQPLGWLDWLGFAAIGTIAAVGHLLLLRAYEQAPASVLAPLGYFEIVSTVALGWLLFGDLPDAWTWTGILVIVGSGVFVTLWTSERASRVAAQAGQPAGS